MSNLSTTLENGDRELSPSGMFTELQKRELGFLMHEFGNLCPLYNLTISIIDQGELMKQEIELLKSVGSVAECIVRRAIHENIFEIDPETRSLLRFSIDQFRRSTILKLDLPENADNSDINFVIKSANSLHKLLGILLKTASFPDFRGDPTLIDLNDSAHQVLKIVNTSHVFEGSVNLPRDLLVEIDDTYLFCALLNLVKNAREACSKFSQEVQHKIKFDLNAKVVSLGDKPFVELVIRDEGPGIPSETVNKVFDLGFSTNIQSEFSRRGYGLTFVKSVVEAAGGRISVASKSITDTPGCTDHFTAFTISLPLLPVNNPEWGDDLNQPKPPGNGAFSWIPGPIRRFLAAED